MTRQPINNKPPKPKKCKGCRNVFQPVRTTQSVCSYQCGILKAQENEKKKEKKCWIAEKKVLKEKLKTLGQYEIEAKREFQKWVRLRDNDLPCISCDNENTDQWDGGHYFKAELYSGLIFNEDNCHKQCKRCNNQLHGNEANYRVGLVKKIGEERVKWLEENKDRLRVYKYTKEQLTELKQTYKNKIKQLNN